MTNMDSDQPKPSDSAIERCAAYRNGICTNGFPTDAICVGFGGPSAVPFCMDEQRTARLFPNTGAPKVIRP